MLFAAIEWSKWVTPEMIVTVFSLVAAVLGWLGKRKAQAVTEAVIKGVEAFRKPLADSEKPEEKAHSDALRDAIKGEALKDGVEGALNPLVQVITQAMKR